MFSAADKTTKPSSRVQRKTDSAFFSSERTADTASHADAFFKPQIQTKISVNQPDDPYEREADHIAEKVVNMEAVAPSANLTAPAEVQREQDQQKEEEQEKETVQRAPVSVQRSSADEDESTEVQTKRMSYGSPNNDTTIQLQFARDTISSTTTISQRPLSRYRSDVIQRSGRGPPGGSGQFESQLQQSTTGGRAMEPAVGEFMSSRFGTDFSGVRIHTDASAQQMSKQVNAHAFTYKNHIYFNSGQYSPHTRRGQTLLAHELTHTIQQGAVGTHAQSKPKHSISHLQRKAVVQRQVAPQLAKAVELAEAEQGKVVANKEGADGNRYGWERLIEYFETTFGKDKIVNQPTGAEGVVYRPHIKKKSEMEGAIILSDGKVGHGKRDAMPSWCGIFAFWALNKAGIPMPKWQLGESFIPTEAAYPPGHTPQPGDLAFREMRSHYGLVVGMEGPNRVKSVNGNTAGDDHLGGEVQVQTHDLSYWHAFFNPMVAKTGNLRDPELGDKDTEPKSFDELMKEKYGVRLKAADQKDKEEDKELQAKSQSAEKEEEQIQRMEAGGTGGFASRGIDFEQETGSIQTKAIDDSPAQQVRNKSPGAMIQGGWLGDAWDAVSGLASDIADRISEGIDAAKDWLIDKVMDFVREIPGYTLLGYILGRDPITGASVNKTPLTLLSAVLDLIPLGGDMVQWVLDYFEATLPVANWLFNAVGRFSSLIGGIQSRFRNFWNRLSISDVGDPEAVIDDVANIFRTTINEIVDFVSDVGGEFLDIVTELAVTVLANFVKEYFPNAYDLLTVVFGEDPITKTPVDRNGTNILNAGLKVLGERGEQIKRQMTENGIFEQCAAWIDRSIALVFSLISDVGNIFDVIWNAISFESLYHPIQTFTEISQAFLTPIARITDFITDAMIQLLAILREALLTRLRDYARETRGYFLITVLIGRDPFTGDRVLRNTENMIHGFFSLMEGGEAQFQQLKESGKIDSMTQQIDNAVKRLNFTWEYVIGLFTSLWESLDWNDFLQPFDVFRRIVATFGDPVLRLIRFVITIVKIVVELLLIAMNFPFETVNNIIQRSLEAFGNIKRDPIGFLKNILRGIKQGFTQFFDNILTHLMSGLATWLFGSLGELGIQMPPDLSFRSILNLIMQILGISVDHIMERVWAKLTEQIGAEKVAKIRGAIDRLTGIWNFIKDVIERGPIAIWEYVQEKLSELWNMVLDAAKNWIMTRIITAVTTRLLSMLDPTGIMAVINSIIAIYRAIQSFIEQLRAMLEILNSFVNGVAEIAAGNVKVAADYLEGAMARGIPVLIGFLANQVGLGGIGRRLAEIIQGIRAKITEGIDWLVERALRIGRPIIDGVLRVIEFGERVVGGIRAAFGAIFGFTAGGEAHRLWVEKNGNSAEIHVASNPMNLRLKIHRWRGLAGDDSAKTQAVENVDTQYRVAKQKGDALAAAEAANDPQRVATAQQQLDAEMETLKLRVMAVFDLMPEAVEGFLRANVGSQFSVNGSLNAAGLRLQEMVSGRGYSVIDKSGNGNAYIRRVNQGIRAYHLDQDGKLRAGVRNTPSVNVQVGDSIVYLTEDNGVGYHVSEININIVVSGRTLNGIRVRRNDGGTIFLPYDQYEIQWTKPRKPTFVGFSASPSTPNLNRTARIRIDFDHLGTGTGANISPNKYAESGYDPSGYWPRAGHLVANSLGGPGGYSSGNIVAMTINANHTTNGMRGIEDAVLRDIRANDAVYDYAVSVEYNTSVQVPPTRVRVSASRVYPNTTLPSSVTGANKDIDNT